MLDPGTEPVDVHFQVFGWGAKYIEVSPIHGSQRSSWIEVDGQKALDVHLLVKLNNELEEALLSIMDCIKVLAPQELVESHHQRALQIMRINELKP
ncbi:MAG: WYL domain-containing protein [Bacteroidales bacterium]|nr:WYL domain-containing protein [Candidatus Colimorpha merdihippi]